MWVVLQKGWGDREAVIYDPSEGEWKWGCATPPRLPVDYRQPADPDALWELDVVAKSFADALSAM